MWPTSIATFRGRYKPKCKWSIGICFLTNSRSEYGCRKWDVVGIGTRSCYLFHVRGPLSTTARTPNFILNGSSYIGVHNYYMCIRNKSVIYRFRRIPLPIEEGVGKERVVFTERRPWLRTKKERILWNWPHHIKAADDMWDGNRQPWLKYLGVTSAPKLQPIETTFGMLQTGMRAPWAIKIIRPGFENYRRFWDAVGKWLLKEVTSR